MNTPNPLVNMLDEMSGYCCHTSTPPPSGISPPDFSSFACWLTAQTAPNGSSRALVTYEIDENAPDKHPLPSVVMDGTTLVVADGEHVRVLDALSCVMLWEKPWPADAAAIIASERETMKSWQSLRWSSCGQAFFDGRGRTQVCEWRALMGGGNLILPVSHRALICLRYQQ